MRTLDLEPLDATFGAVVRGVKLASIDEPTWQAHCTQPGCSTRC
jgi:hypothetical protein